MANKIFKSSAEKNFLKQILSRHSNMLITEGVLLLIVSVLMLIWPTTSLFLLVATLGIAATLFGVIYMIQSIMSARGGVLAVDIIFSLLSIALGVLLIIYPQVSFSVFIVLVATVFLVRSIYLLVLSIRMVRIDAPSGWWSIVIAVLSLLLSGFIIVFPIGAAYAITIYMALSLMFYAISDLVIASRMAKIKKQLGK